MFETDLRWLIGLFLLSCLVWRLYILSHSFLRLMYSHIHHWILAFSQISATLSFISLLSFHSHDGISYQADHSRIILFNIIISHSFWSHSFHRYLLRIWHLYQICLCIIHANFTFIIIWRNTRREKRLKYCTIFIFASQMRMSVLKNCKKYWEKAQEGP